MSEAILAVTIPAAVWITIGLVTTLVFAILLIALVRHVILLMRSVERFQDEMNPILEEMTAASDAARRAGTRALGEEPSTRP